jgi:enterochelin esterase-like enzyme
MLVLGLGLGLGLATLAAVAARGRGGHGRAARRDVTARIVYGSFASRALRGTDHYAVYLPRGYAGSRTRFPVVYYLHGLPASANAYRAIGAVVKALEDAGERAIVVGVQGARAGDTDPEWRDWGPGRNWETASAAELVRTIDHRYRTIAARRARLLVGISAGGYGATLIAFHFPAVYSVIESWSGYFRATNPAGTAALDLGAADANEWANFHELIPRIRTRFARYLTSTYYGFYVGTNDRRFRAENEQTYREFRAYRIPHVYFRIYNGGHSWSLWQEHAEVWLAGGLRFAAKPRG